MLIHFLYMVRDMVDRSRTKESTLVEKGNAQKNFVKYQKLNGVPDKEWYPYICIHFLFSCIS